MARLSAVDADVTAKESQVAVLQGAVATLSTDVAAADDAAVSLTSRASQDQASWCALRDSALDVQSDLSSLTTLVSSFSQLTTAFGADVRYCGCPWAGCVCVCVGGWVGGWVAACLPVPLPACLCDLTCLAACFLQCLRGWAFRC